MELQIDIWLLKVKYEKKMATCQSHTLHRLGAAYYRSRLIVYL